MQTIRFVKKKKSLNDAKNNAVTMIWMHKDTTECHQSFWTNSDTAIIYLNCNKLNWFRIHFSAPRLKCLSQINYNDGRDNRVSYILFIWIINII